MNTKLKTFLVPSGILLLSILFGLNYACFKFDNIVTEKLCGLGVNVSSEEYKESQKEGAKLAQKIEEEGITLLKNDNNTLPLSKSQMKLNVFGFGGCDNGFIYQGGGSGAGSGEGAKSFYYALKDYGVNLNTELCDFYNGLSFRRSGYTETVKDYYRLYEPDISLIDGKILDNAKEFSDTSIIVLSRRGCEGTDLPKVQYDENGNVDSGRIYSGISKKEEELISLVCNNFNNVIVVLNNANSMELGFLNDPLIDSALAIYLPGNHGSLSVAPILYGDKNPSGKTVDTYPYKFNTAPSYCNSGSDGTHWYINELKKCYQQYSEDIYVGYQWYETADSEDFWSDVNNEYGKGYDGVVQYPFGFGLSYTSFSWKIASLSNIPYTVLNKDDTLSFKVIVENTGTCAGQDVVELYVTTPYIKGEIEKSSVKLCGFAKTDILDPGELQILDMDVKLSDLASYDCFDKNNNGFVGYELDGGKYTFSFRTDSHNIKKLDNVEDYKNGIIEYSIGKSGFKYASDSRTNHPVSNLFTNFSNTKSGVSSTRIEDALSREQVAYSVDGLDAGLYFSYLTRNDFISSYPIFSDLIQWTAKFKNETWFVKSPRINEDDKMPTLSSEKTKYTIKDMAGLSFNDPKWDQFIEQLDLNTLVNLVSKGGYGTCSVPSIGKPRTIAMDGPSGLNVVLASSETGYGINYPCATVLGSTWSVNLAYSFGKSVGNEAESALIDGWYAPGANIHRSGLGGRNFEYFSEDSLVSGILSSYISKGCKEDGVSVYMKHFVLNDSDTGRNGQYKYVTEQALREIYCKPFEIAIKTGEVNGIMSSVDRVGTVRASGSSALLQNLLRDERGFNGCVITDAYQGGDINDVDECIRAGCDLMLNIDGKSVSFDDLSSATAVIALQKSAKNILYQFIDSKYYAANTKGLELSAVIGTKEEIFPWWIPVLITIDVIIICAISICYILFFKKSKSK